MTRLARAGLLLALLALPGCVYYNGVYNARRLTHEAETAEREGRRFEAQGLYAQAAVKAESVLARHPESDWADDARFLRGNALARTQACDRGVPDLELVAMTSPDTALAGRALDVLAGCYLALERPGDAALAFERRWNRADSLTRARLAPEFVRALREAGRAPEAAPILASWAAGVDPVDRIGVLAGVGRDSVAAAVLDSLLLAGGGRSVDWAEVTAGFAGDNPAFAVHTARRVARADSIPAPARVALLVEVADHERRRDPAAARALYVEALAVAGDPRVAGPARASLAELALETADTADLRWIADSLGAVVALGGSHAVVANRRSQGINRWLGLRDSLAGADSVPHPDLWHFLMAELVRDSVGAPHAAASLFEAVAVRHDSSAYAAKALLAAALLDPASRDSLVALAMQRYPASPYILALQGEAGPTYHQLEDSLRQWTAEVFRRRPTGVRPRGNNNLQADDLP